MTRGSQQLEKDILVAFKCACREDRLDIADVLLAALEALDRDRQGQPDNDRPLLEAYRKIGERK